MRKIRKRGAASYLRRAGLLAVLLAGMGCSIFGCAAKEQETAKQVTTAGRVFLDAQRLYEARQNETIVTVPIYAEDADLRAYELTVTYDPETLQLTEADMTTDGIFTYLEETETPGTVQIAGATVQETAASVDGQIGTLTFLLTKKIMEDGVCTPIGLSASATGIAGEEKKAETSGCVVVLNRSREENMTEAAATAAASVQTEDAPAAVTGLAFDAWAHPDVLDIGDLDGDGNYGADDAQRALAIAADPDTATEDDLQRADIDGDGDVTEDDALLLVQAAAGAYTNFGYAEPEDAHTIYVDSKGYTRGNYCFGSLTEAVAYLNVHQPESESERIIVLLAPGVYREHTTLDAPYVTFAAMDEQAAQWPNITYYYGCGMRYSSIGNGQSEAGEQSASTIISSEAHDFSARHVMFENSYNIYITKEEQDDFAADNKPTLAKRTEELTQSSCQTQALALQLNADRSTLYDCRIIGRQDTFLMNDSNRVYCEDCYIEGTVDFIYGSATAVLDGCTINSPYRTGHITAASTPDDQPYGFLLKDCTLTRDATTGMDAPEDGSYSLGRPWRTSAMVTYYNCRMDGHIAAKHNADSDDYDRFMSMGTGAEKEDARYAEYGTMDLDGNLLDLTAICPDYEKILTDADMDGFYAPIRWLEARYNTSTKTLEYDGWNPGGYAEPET